MSQRAGPRSERTGRGLFFLAAALSVVVHGLAGWVLAAGDVSLPPPELSTRLASVRLSAPEFERAPEVPLPRPVAPLVRPAEPGAGEVPSAGSSDPEPPEVIPHDIAPRLVNGPEVLAALAEGYPEDLPEEASRSLVLLWLFVDTGGRVARSRLESSSGYEELDALARRVAPDMAYTPARYRGERVAVWIAQRIRFRPPPGHR